MLYLAWGWVGWVWVLGSATCSQTAGALYVVTVVDLVPLALSTAYCIWNCHDVAGVERPGQELGVEPVQDLHRESPAPSAAFV